MKFLVARLSRFVGIDEGPVINNKSVRAAINAVESVSEEASILNYKL